MEKERLNYLLTGEEKPKFVTERENVIIDKCLELINKKEKFNVQVWQSGANAWDDCKPVALEATNPMEVVKSIVRVTGQQVRVTYPFGGITDVGRLNGHYIHPNDLKS
jgi:hypothetical protein